MYSPETIARFWSKVDRTGECWIWTGFCMPAGHGQLTISQKRVLAHRVAYMIETGAPIPEGVVIRHRCDNPPCVRFSHLLPGTQQDNVADMMERGRNQFGTRNGCAILTDGKVRIIKGRLRNGETHTAIAASLGISRSLVSFISEGKRWRHVGI